MPNTKKLAELVRKAKLAMWGRSGLSSQAEQDDFIASYLVANGVKVLERDENLVILPKRSSVFTATFQANDIIGTLHIGEETHQVYLGEMQAHNLVYSNGLDFDGNRLESCKIKRKFVLIEV
jgi:hypothetical protein